MEMGQTKKLPLLLGTPFLNTVGATIDFPNKKVVLKNINAKVFYPVKTYSTEFCGTIASEEMKPQDEVEITNEKMGLASPLKACEKKEEFHKEQALGYGNDEETFALNGDLLETVFHTTMENGVESSKSAKKETKTKTKGKNGPNTLDRDGSMLGQPSIMTLTPWKYENGVIEYKIKCRGRPKPFALVRALLTPELKEKGPPGIQEIMSKTLTLELKDKSRSSTTPLTPA